MQQTRKPVSKALVILMWAILLGNLLFWCGFWIWRHRHDGPPAPADGPEILFRGVAMLISGAFFFVAGVAGYFVVLFTNCLTFDFGRPIWSTLRRKIFLVNILVPLLVAMGVGFTLAAFVAPILMAFGLSPALAGLLPALGMVVVLQIVQMWVQVWAPLEKRVIYKRLAAQGVSAAQVRGATLVGLSDPTQSSFKKFGGGIEDDIGALWVSPDRLVYFGDMEQFAITPEQLVQLERKADAGSATILSGMAHVILHVRLPDGALRQIRLHVEGLPTMGKRRQAMDQLAAAIADWHSRAAATGQP
jgi:hypothetical protein